VLVKRPGDKNWIPDGSAAANKVRAPKCPEAMGTGDIEMVAP